MNKKSIALVIFGDESSTRNALTEDNYKPLADALIENGFNTESVLYHDTRLKHLEEKLPEFDAIMVWVDPIVRGSDGRTVDRRPLDELLIKAAENGVLVSTHPEIIKKIGTKLVLHTAREMDWGGDVELYSDYETFEKHFFTSLENSRDKIRILKKYRGSSGNGVYKVRLTENKISIIHAPSPNDNRIISKEKFLKEFNDYFITGGILINQNWVKGITNGMVRSYMTGTKVTGFGYQESIALCPYTDDPASPIRPLSRRFYFSEHCGLFQDLRNILETKWIPELLKLHSIPLDAMPLLWDIDLFINDVNTRETEKKYSLCEINVSGVSPFPPSCISYIVDELKVSLLPAS